MAADAKSGWGRLFLDPQKQHADILLWRRAIRQRWNIDDAFKDVAVQRLRAIIEQGADDEIALKAIAEVRHLVAQNQKDEHKVVDVTVQTRHDNLPGIAADLGIEIGALTDATGQGEGGADDFA